MSFEFQEPPRLSVKSPRSLLLRVHSDLFKVDRCASPYVYPFQLSCFEEMVLVLEDRRFFRHTGVDLQSVVREFVRACLFLRHGGASTIDMQLVRTVTGYKKRKLSRKLYEMLLARILQYRYSKIQILRAYLNCAFFGSHLIGASAASAKMYGKHPDTLDASEASTLAALLVYPRPQEPTEVWRSKVERRAKYAMNIRPRLKEKLQQLKRT